MKKNKTCIFEGVEENGKKATMKPAVNCNKKCESCGWNPEEQARRLKEGRFVKDATVVIRHYINEQDNRGTLVAYAGLKQLRFPPRRNSPAKSSA